jgi:hypothetical protein
MIIRSNDKAGVHESNDHVQISARMLAESVNELDHSHRRSSRHIYPAMDCVSLVI